ncbi:hypothetical protein Pmani_023250 [Petrolisthes manimaculis]|uniref:Integrase catalytic domain-containing protein n=1 Tax=Petrolisthes manimaculis TaxID=1843537 RepID=A0AAE1PA12_9EUCA|nr:hypothetical protein Pmani_023250 [Petrolisthes manimaculis]
MLKEVQKKYANVTTAALELFKSLCEECQKKRKRPMTKGVVVRPILSKDLTSRGQVDLIDMQAMAHRNFKWIMVYQDHFTKFCVLRPLTTKRATEVAMHLLDIFLLFGAPAILQSDNGSEFTSHVITELKAVWPDLTIVHGKPRHPQSQGSVERANGDLKDMLIAWLADNNTQDWTAGIKFVQFQKNSAYHSGIKCSPYSAMFGCEARVGLTSSSLPQEVISRLESETDLLAATENVSPETVNTTTTPAVNHTTTATVNHTTTPAAATVNHTTTPAATTVNHTPDSPSLVKESMSAHIAQIKRKRGLAYAGQMAQAERMVKRSRLDLKAGEGGDNVAVPIPAVDRAIVYLKASEMGEARIFYLH